MKALSDGANAVLPIPPGLGGLVDPPPPPAAAPWDDIDAYEYLDVAAVDYQTALAPDELITGVTLPPRDGNGWAIDEVARRHGDFALAGAAAALGLDAAGAVATVRIALFGVHERAVLAASAMRAIAGRAPSPDAIEAAADAAASQDADPASDVHASGAYRRHVAGTLVGRALERLAA